MTTRKELVEALRVRYRDANYGVRVKILDEFAALTGYHRKHAIRLLGGEGIAGKATPKRNRLYDEAVRQALTVLWEPASTAAGQTQYKADNAASGTLSNTIDCDLAAPVGQR